MSSGDTEGWEIHPEHFAERHGLIVIIALGESLIVAAAALVGVELQGQLLVTAVLAVDDLVRLVVDLFPDCEAGAGGRAGARRGT